MLNEIDIFFLILCLSKVSSKILFFYLYKDIINSN